MADKLSIEKSGADLEMHRLRGDNGGAQLLRLFLFRETLASPFGPSDLRPLAL